MRPPTITGMPTVNKPSCEDLLQTDSAGLMKIGAARLRGQSCGTLTLGLVFLARFSYGAFLTTRLSLPAAAGFPSVPYLLSELKLDHYS